MGDDSSWEGQKAQTHSKHKLLVNVLLGYIWLEIWRLQEAQEKLINELGRNEASLRLTQGLGDSLTAVLRTLCPIARPTLSQCPGTWRCGQAASKVGSSSSGSNSAPVGFDEGGSVRKRFTEN